MKKHSQPLLTAAVLSFLTTTTSVNAAAPNPIDEGKEAPGAASASPQRARSASPRGAPGGAAFEPLDEKNKEINELESFFWNLPHPPKPGSDEDWTLTLPRDLKKNLKRFQTLIEEKQREFPHPVRAEKLGRIADCLRNRAGVYYNPPDVRPVEEDLEAVRLQGVEPFLREKAVKLFGEEVDTPRSKYRLASLYLIRDDTGSLVLPGRERIARKEMLLREVWAALSGKPLSYNKKDGGDVFVLYQTLDELVRMYTRLSDEVLAHASTNEEWRAETKRLEDERDSIQRIWSAYLASAREGSTQSVTF